MKNYIVFLIITISIAANANPKASLTDTCALDTLGYAQFIQTLSDDEVPLQFHVHNNFAVIIGYVNGSTPLRVQNLINDYPEVTTLIFYFHPGSDDDEANIEASMLLYQQNYTMYVPANGLIASGGVDMFMAGNQRVIDEGALIGVHSWSDGVNDATDFPVGHIYHQFYIDYYVSIGYSQQIAEDFYYFTINSASADGIHWMTEAEINQYQLRFCFPNEPATAIQNLINDDLITITPNPATTYFELKSEIQGDIESLKVLNINGQIMLEQTKPLGNHFNVSNWPNGMYYLTITTTSGQLSQKLLK